MFSLLLVIIYIAFISLGLPDSLLGSAWPVIRDTFGVPLSFAGIVSMIIAGGTIFSSLMSERLTRKLGTGLVTAISVGMTAAALFGFSASNSFVIICLWAIPFGLGAGAVDAALNNYVALYYASRHMSWLHCFWGVGASISPYIMGYFLGTQFGWRGGYRTVSAIQIFLTIALFASLQLWKNKKRERDRSDNVSAKPLSITQAVRIRGVPFILIAFFGYCGLETTAGLWASSYLVEYRGVNVETAAMFASLFYLGITFGRFLNGFVADKFGDRKLIRFGVIVAMIGRIMVGIPFETDTIALAGLIVIGLGCAPVYPSIIHATPSNFGKDNSQAIIGIQMASAYTGTTFMPPLFGLIANSVNIGLYPLYLALVVVLILAMTETLNRVLGFPKKSSAA